MIERFRNRTDIAGNLNSYTVCRKAEKIEIADDSGIVIKNIWKIRTAVAFLSKSAEYI